MRLALKSLETIVAVRVPSLFNGERRELQADAKLELILDTAQDHVEIVRVEQPLEEVHEGGIVTGRRPSGAKTRHVVKIIPEDNVAGSEPLVLAEPMPLDVPKPEPKKVK